MRRHLDEIKFYSLSLSLEQQGPQDRLLNSKPHWRFFSEIEAGRLTNSLKFWDSQILKLNSIYSADFVQIFLQIFLHLTAQFNVEPSRNVN